MVFSLVPQPPQPDSATLVTSVHWPESTIHAFSDGTRGFADQLRDVDMLIEESADILSVHAQTAFPPSTHDRSPYLHTYLQHLQHLQHILTSSPKTKKWSVVERVDLSQCSPIADVLSLGFEPTSLSSVSELGLRPSGSRWAISLWVAQSPFTWSTRSSTRCFSVRSPLLWIYPCEIIPDSLNACSCIGTFSSYVRERSPESFWWALKNKKWNWSLLFFIVHCPVWLIAECLLMILLANNL